MRGPPGLRLMVGGAQAGVLPVAPTGSDRYEVGMNFAPERTEVVTS